MIRVGIASDFNAEMAGRYLAADGGSPACSFVAAPFGQLFQSLAGQLSADPIDAALVWTRPEGAIPEFARLLEGERVDPARLLSSVEQFAGQVERFARNTRFSFVATWVRSDNGRGLGMRDWKEDGHAHLLARMNLKLAEVLASASNVYLLDSQRWLDAAGAHARESKYWFTMKSPFTEAVFKEAARDVKAALRGLLGQSRKLVLVDLDDTLWGGIVGDQGWEDLRLGGHDHVGEAFVEFQKALKELTGRGIQVGLVSKNDAAVALEAIDKHPEMRLRRQDLAGWRINWNDKARNIVELVEELNLGLQSVVFIDDNPAERGRVREALPDVLVPDWPADPVRYAQTLRQLDCFDQPAVTDEDRGRTRMYVEQRERQSSLAAFPSAAEWLLSLGIKVAVAPLSGSNIKRVTQLLNKTNQMNLSGRRLSESELRGWLAAGPQRAVHALTVSDRFGDVGLTGIVSWQRDGEDLHVVDFVLSCRAMGRKVEETMVHLAVEAARALGATRVLARLIATERNGPCREFWQQSGLQEAEPGLFVWQAAADFPQPACVSLLRMSDPQPEAVCA
jgi:FkbH-like protein